MSRHRTTSTIALLLSLLSAACAPAPAPATPPTPPPVELLPPPVLPPAETPAPLPAAPPRVDPPIDPALFDDIAKDPASELERSAVLVRKAEWRQARKALTAALGALGSEGPLDTRMVAHALLARACAALKDDACITAELAALSTLLPGSEAHQRLDALPGDDATKQRRTARSMAAAGEILFLAAEQKRARADRIARPVYRGAGDQKEVLAFLSGKVAAWVKAKRSAIEDVEKAYVLVVTIQPAPSPRWVVAAGERVGSMWAGFVDEFRNAPMPAVWRGDGPVPGGSGLRYDELRETYLSQLAEASEPQLDRARTAYTKCSEIAARYHLADERSRACDAWLAAHPAPTGKP